MTTPKTAPETVIPMIAKVCHEANRAYCETHMDYTQKPWDKAAKWQQESAIKGVKFALENRDATPADQHQAWLEDKLAQGWTHGDHKDPEKKTHPCLVPYDKLPEIQRGKDHIFRGIVRAMAAFFGL